ncbi:DUF229 domain-containing protein [Pseudomethylobacillus aquaticus]|uniref:DUF229 domain-containing protein n=1 Tax=Pseudomethylobacillus aquaticus TaxID=2676064 RepID=A0A3N0UZX6_9PROT|nr:DUF229 domain-containing protein [Pseudomethylobacillus aquaticus]
MQSIHTTTQRSSVLQQYCFISYLLVLFIIGDSIQFSAAATQGMSSLILLLMTWLCYGAYFMLPAALIISLAAMLGRYCSRRSCASLTAAVAILATTLTSLLLHAKAKIHALYGMFINGFIVNLLITPGGLGSLGGSEASNIGFALIAVGFVLMHTLLWWAIYRLNGTTQLAPFLSACRHTLAHKRLLTWRPSKRFVLLALAVASLTVHGAYATQEAFNRVQQNMLMESVPFFQPVTARSFFRKMGYELSSSPNLKLGSRLHYPKQPLSLTMSAQAYNIVWLTSESWRADMLNPQVMPATSTFASKAQRFNHHFSGGNGTRMGVFSMFTGLPGNYWFPFKEDQRSAALLDVLQQQHYQMRLFTSADFSYPEFDRALFSKVPASQLKANGYSGLAGWQNDRQNVTDMLEFIDQRDPQRPFFSFMFFESPHARYYFPPESAIRKPYRDDINYATLSRKELRADMGLIKNRYVNAVHHLDSQFARVFEHLEQKGLLETTIVVVVGDHGEEFMEHGFWGHNSTFVDEQIRTPLLVYLPGKKGQTHEHMTSHMDIVPTLMPLLGVNNPVADYALGQNLLKADRQYTYVSDWNRIAYVDANAKMVMNVTGTTGNYATGSDDHALSMQQQRALTQRSRPIIMQTMQDLNRFLDK